MELKKAMLKSGISQARIKCQYVELYDANGNKIFSLQKSAYGTGYIGAAASMATDKYGRVKLALAQDVQKILATYYKQYVKDSHGVKPGVKSIQAAETVVYVNPAQCDWDSIDPRVIPVVTGDGVKYQEEPAGLSGKTKLALAAAALVALFGN